MTDHRTTARLFSYLWLAGVVQFAAFLIATANNCTAALSAFNIGARCYGGVGAFGGLLLLLVSLLGGLVLDGWLMSSTEVKRPWLKASITQIGVLVLMYLLLVVVGLNLILGQFLLGQVLLFIVPALPLIIWDGLAQLLVVPLVLTIMINRARQTQSVISLTTPRTGNRV